MLQANVVNREAIIATVGTLGWENVWARTLPTLSTASSRQTPKCGETLALKRHLSIPFLPPMALPAFPRLLTVLLTPVPSINNANGMTATRNIPPNSDALPVEVLPQIPFLVMAVLDTITTDRRMS